MLNRLSADLGPVPATAGSLEAISAQSREYVPKKRGVAQQTVIQATSRREASHQVLGKTLCLLQPASPSFWHGMRNTEAEVREGIASPGPQLKITPACVGWSMRGSPFSCCLGRRGEEISPPQSNIVGTEKGSSRLYLSGLPSLLINFWAGNYSPCQHLHIF